MMSGEAGTDTVRTGRRATRRRVALLALALPLFLAGGCVTTGGSASNGDQNVLTREEIQDADLSNLYDVVQRLRPRWLRDVRGQRSFNVEGGIVVYQRQTFLGGPGVLRQWRPSAVARMVFLDGVSASNELPGPASNRHVEGAIVLYTRN